MMSKLTCDSNSTVWKHPGSVSSAPAPSTHTHSYNNKGYCSCGQAYQYSFVSNAFSGIITQTVNLKTRPYGAETTARTLYAGNSVSIVGYTVNHYGNKWCKTSKDDWVYSESVSNNQKPIISISGQNTPSKLNVGDMSMNVSFTGSFEYGWSRQIEYHVFRAASFGPPYGVLPR